MSARIMAPPKWGLWVSLAGLIAACSVSEGDGDFSGDDAGTTGKQPAPTDSPDAEVLPQPGASDSGDTEPPMGDMDAQAPEPTGPVSVIDLGEKALSPGGVALTLDIPEGAESFALVVDGSAEPEDLILAERVTTPSGEVVFDFEDDISINRTDATFGFYTLLVPTNPVVKPEPGQWLVSLRSGDEEFDANVTLIVKNEPAMDKVLDLNLYFVGLDGFSAADAVDDDGFKEVLASVSQVYEDAGIALGEVTYNAIDGDDAETYGVIDTEAELGEMFELVPNDSSQALNLFLVNDIAMGDAGLSILGLAGGVPGPPTLQGTSTSGVAVNMGSYLAAVAGEDAEMITKASEELEIIIAHEAGHFLGLFHTVERNGVALDGEIVGEDPLSDTLTCPDSADTNEDNRLSPAECVDDGADNLMFWSPANDSRTLSDEQGEILLRNPIVR